MEKAKKTDQDAIIAKLINKGDEDAKEQLRCELKKRYENQTDDFIDTAVNMAMEAKGNQSSEDLVKTFMEV